MNNYQTAVTATSATQKRIHIDNCIFDYWNALLGANLVGLYMILMSQGMPEMYGNSFQVAEGFQFKHHDFMRYLKRLDKCGLIQLIEPPADMKARDADLGIRLVLPPPQKPSPELIDEMTGGHPENYHPLAEFLNRSEGEE